MNCSQSQIKTFCGSKAKWAGQYILWIKDEYANDSLLIWSMLEHYLMTGEDNYEILTDKPVYDMEKLMETYDDLKYNAEWLSMPRGDTQVKVEGEINGVKFVWYLDNLHDWICWDVKTAHYLSKEDQSGVNQWSNMTYFQEYELQLWIYMKLGGFKVGRIAEVGKFRYKDQRVCNQIIEYVWSDEWDKKMCDKFFPIINEMKELYEKHLSK